MPHFKLEKNLITSIETCPPLPLQRHTGREPGYVLAPDVILVTVEDGSARLLDMAGSFHAVPEVGARMLKETLAHGPDAAAAHIAQDYGVVPRQVRDDLAVFLRDLEDKGLVCSARSRGSRRRRGFGLASLVLTPALRALHRVRSSKTKSRALLALARFSFALFGWTRTIAVWQEAHAGFPARPAGESNAETLKAVDTAVREAAAGHPVAVACKERALTAWSLARAAGLDASVVVGIALFPIVGHCWCEAGAQTLGDGSARDHHCYTPVARW